ncbi:MAG: VanZ family protein [Clostridia bacterium]|nr:VanZ family protein [Clostridia bacterium]
MKKKAMICVSSVLYMVSILMIMLYFFMEFSHSIALSPLGRMVILLLSCLLMYFGGILISQNIEEKYKEIPLKINIWIWFLLYMILIFTLTLFDSYFNRGNIKFQFNFEVLKNYFATSCNIIPFQTILKYVLGFMNGNIAPYIFVYNIFGNIVAFMPFAFFLPLLLKKQNKFRNFFITMIEIVGVIEILQFITLNGSCDIDDLILNVSGACMMFGILHIHAINRIIHHMFLREDIE